MKELFMVLRTISGPLDNYRWMKSLFAFSRPSQTIDKEQYTQTVRDSSAAAMPGYTPP